MANDLKTTIDRWSTEAVENISRRAAVIGISVGLVVLGIVLIAVSGDSNTYEVYSCDDTGQCSWSTKHPPILTSLGHFAGIIVIAIGGLMLISFGIKMYKKMTAGPSTEHDAVSGSATASYTSSATPPTPPATIVTPPAHADVTRSTWTDESAGPVGTAPVSRPSDPQPTPRLKGKLAK